MQRFQEISVDELELSARPRRALEVANIKTVNQLLKVLVGKLPSQSKKWFSARVGKNLVGVNSVNEMISACMVALTTEKPTLEEFEVREGANSARL